VAGTLWRAGHLRTLISYPVRQPLTSKLRRSIDDQIPMQAWPARGWIVREVTPRDGEEPIFVRLYAPRAWHVAARNIRGDELLRGQNLRVPSRLGYGFVRSEGRPCFAIAERRAPGRILSETPLNTTIAHNIGRDLARLHQAPCAPFVVRMRRNLFAARASSHDLTRSPTLPGVDDDLMASLAQDATLVHDGDFLGPIGVNHGGVTTDNLLYDERDGITWIDLDDVSIHPFRLALAAAELRLFCRAPPLIEAFNEAYFEARPDAAAAWAAHRLTWYRFFLARRVKNVGWLVRRGDQPLNNFLTCVAMYRAAIGFAEPGHPADYLAAIESLNKAH
jgi:hypothetical protein